VVHKSKLIVLILFTFSIIALLLLISQISLACYLAPGTFYVYCYSNNYCEKDEDCGEVPISAYDFDVDFGGCVMAYAAGQYYNIEGSCSSLSESCTCSEREARWYTSPSYPGQICKRRDGWYCDAGIKEGKYDPEDGCIMCSDKIQIERFGCSYDISTWECEALCGAPSVCDEVMPDSSLPDSCTESKLEVNRYCNSNCDYSSTTYYCDPSKCGESKSCRDQTYYCIYDNGRKWSTSKPSGFCCSNDDCPGYDPKTKLKLVCDQLTHACVSLPSCYTNEQCAPGYCCDTITKTYSCNNTQKGTILNYGGKSYLCDPPEGFVEVKYESEKQTKKLGFFDILINFFSLIFSRYRI